MRNIFFLLIFIQGLVFLSNNLSIDVDQTKHKPTPIVNSMILHIQNSEQTICLKNNEKLVNEIPVKEKIQKINKKSIMIVDDHEISQYSRRHLQTNSTSKNQTEFIKNGDFSNTTCIYTYCIYYKDFFKPEYVAYWQPLPEIEIGYASFYRLTGTQTIRGASVAGDHTTCFRQLVQNLPAGLYELRYTYTPQWGLQYSKLSVLLYLNDTLIDRRYPPNNEFNNVTLSNISISNQNDSVYIKFCGDPNVSSVFGSAIYNVSFKLVTPFPKQNTTTSPTNSSANITNSSNTTNETSNVSQMSNSSQMPNNSQVSNNSQTSNGSQNTSTINIDINTGNTVNTMNMSEVKKLFNNVINSDQMSNHNSTQKNLFNSTFNDIINQQFSNNKWQSRNQSQKTLVFFGINLKVNLKANVTSVVDIAMKIPLVRQLLSGYFSFFVNLDHLWLYIYHQRQYGVYVKKFLVQIHIFEQSKWNFIAKEFQESILHLPQIQQSLNQKFKQTPTSFTSIEGDSRQFLENTFKFFIVNVPLTLVLFFLARIIYIFLKKFGLQSILNDFALNSALILIYLEGNSQSFVYYLISDLTMLFSFVFKTKILNIVVLMIFFTILFVLIASPFILRSIYQRRKRIEFYSKCKNSLKGSIFFMVEFGLFNMMLASVHLLCEKRPNLQLYCLLVLETGFLLYLLKNFNRKRVYTLMFPIWITIFTCFVRLLLIVSYFWFEFGEGSLKEIVQNVQLAYIILYLFLWIMSIIHSLIAQFKGMIQIIYMKIHTKCAKLKKINTETKILNKKCAQLSQNLDILEKVFPTGCRQKHKNKENEKHVNIIQTKDKNLNFTKYKTDMGNNSLKVLKQKSERKIRLKKFKSRKFVANIQIEILN